MTPEPVEARISAYLDGELSADERAQVEALLAENAAARQLHDELRALRTSMKSLERHKLDDRFTAEVMRRARQAAAEAQEKPQPKVSLAPPTGELSWWRRGSGMRRWVWPAAAVAAALAVLLYDSTQRNEERQVAQAPDEAAEALSRAEPEASLSEAPASAPVPANSDMRWSAPPQRASQAEGAAGAPAPAIEKSAEQNRAQDSLRAPLAPLPVEANMPVTAPATPATAPGDAAPMVRSLAKSRAVAVPQAEFEVPAEYLREKKFEALLTEQNVPWHNESPSLAVARNSQVEDRSARESDAKDQVMSYQITVSREQLAALLAGLPQPSKASRAFTSSDAYSYFFGQRHSGNLGAEKAAGEDPAAAENKVKEALPFRVADDNKSADANERGAQTKTAPPRTIVIRLRAAASEPPAAATEAPPK